MEIIMNTSKSKSAFEDAKRYIPGGVNSPVRAFANVGMNPLFIDKAAGSKIYDIDGNEYIDYVGSWGPMLLGHAFSPVVEAVREAACGSTSFGAPCISETRLAKCICETVSCVDVVRMVNSGTEATMSAIRLARGYTGRNLIIKFEGCYHGHSDSLLIKAGSGALTFGSASSAGVVEELAKYTLVLPYNDFDAVEDAFKKFGEEIAAVIIEPVAGNMGVVKPADGFLLKIRELTREYKSVFIVDEVMTGFRVSPSGAVGLFGIEPDIITFGKIIGGGLPVGAYGGKREIMEFISPLGPVYQAGTLSGNPLAMAAGLAQLTYLRENPQIYDLLEESGAYLEAGFNEAAKTAGADVCINRVGSMMSVFFTKERVEDFDTANTSDTEKFKIYFKSMLNSGIYLAPSQFEAVFLSAAHSRSDLDKTIEAAFKAMKAIQ
ncbi:MAG: glutamate-1-semialdehyde 2,1-aminomutase [Oscillospiraceae bacterium]|nr:glutamate-1-semialdehyde 2,1-aminomutase [Oscillospiraceae bacterium]